MDLLRGNFLCPVCVSPLTLLTEGPFLTGQQGVITASMPPGVSSNAAQGWTAWHLKLDHHDSYFHHVQAAEHMGNSLTSMYLGFLICKTPSG